MDISEVRKGSKIMLDGVPYNVEEAEFMKPGKGSAIYRYKLRNLIDGTNLNKTYHSGEKFTGANVSTREGQFLYRDGNQAVLEQGVRDIEQRGIPRLAVDSHQRCQRPRLLPD